MTYNPTIIPSQANVDGLQQQITALDQQKANASTVGGLATQVNSKADQSALNSLSATVSGKADASSVSAALSGKADASTVSALSTAVAGKADASALAGKADTGALTALAATVPTIANETPMAEATGGAAGLDGMKVPGAKHRHPRLTSTTVGTIAAGNTATIVFTRSFADEPGIDYMELPPTSNTTTPVAGDLAATAQPTACKVIAWTKNAGGEFTGCTIRVFKSQTIPQNLVTLLLGAVFNLFGASVVGTRFSIIALARSDVP